MRALSQIFLAVMAGLDPAIQDVEASGWRRVERIGGGAITSPVIPAKAGIQFFRRSRPRQALDPRFRGGDIGEWPTSVAPRRRPVITARAPA